VNGTDTVIRLLEARIRDYRRPRAVVAFSGGVDSTVVLAVGAKALGASAVTAVTAISPSYPAGELDAARAAAAGVGVVHRTIRTREVEREAYARNDPDRCFHCKAELYGALRRLAADAPCGSVLLTGTNADDLADFRPGLAAARRQGVQSPLLQQGLGKQAVRAVAHRLGLPTADKPALACLSSRVAYGIRITPPLLSRIDRAERAIRALGFDMVRVRHFGQRATIEVPGSDIDRLCDHPALPELVDRLEALGWVEVAVDPRGYRAGSLNPV
jgi:pyridinium-3,5-biscarboxylic acid mononucleotide sulfurtransferase